MSSVQHLELEPRKLGSFRNPVSTALIMGLLAATVGCSPVSILLPSTLIVTPAVIDRSRERCAFCLLEGVLILFLVAVPLAAVFGTMDSRWATPAVWHCVPSIQYFNPAFNDSGIPYQWRAMISFTAFTGFCYFRLAARLCRKNFRIVASSCLAGTAISSALFPLSWSASFPAQWTPIEETYTEYFLSHLLLGLSWGAGGMLTAYVATKLLHQQTKDQRNNAPPS